MNLAPRNMRFVIWRSYKTHVPRDIVFRGKVTPDINGLKNVLVTASYLNTSTYVCFFTRRPLRRRPHGRRRYYARRPNPTIHDSNVQNRTSPLHSSPSVATWDAAQGFQHIFPRVLGTPDRGTLQHFVFKEVLLNTFFTHCPSKGGSTLRITRKAGVVGQNCPACESEDVTELSCNRAWVFCTKFETNASESINGSISDLVSKPSDFYVSLFGRV